MLATTSSVTVPWPVMSALVWVAPLFQQKGVNTKVSQPVSQSVSQSVSQPVSN